jgi:hypothetical protein
MKRHRRKRSFVREPLSLESRNLLSGIAPVLTMGNYRELVHEIDVAALHASANHDVKALEERIEQIAAHVPRGKTQLAPILENDAESVDLRAKGSGKSLRDSLRNTLADDVHDDAALGLLHLKGRGAKTLAQGSLPSQFAPYAPFNVSGTNFRFNFNATPIFTTQTQNLSSSQVNLTLRGINDTNGNQWVDMDFESPTTLASNSNGVWQSGPINNIRLTRTVTLSNMFFYFTYNGNAITGNLGNVPNQIYAGANPINVLRPAVPQVFFFNNFRPGQASTLLNLGSGISSGFQSFATLLSQLNIPSNVNGLHLFFLAQ